MHIQTFHKIFYILTIYSSPAYSLKQFNLVSECLNKTMYWRSESILNFLIYYTKFSGRIFSTPINISFFFQSFFVTNENFGLEAIAKLSETEISLERFLPTRNQSPLAVLNYSVSISKVLLSRKSLPELLLVGLSPSGR